MKPVLFNYEQGDMLEVEKLIQESSHRIWLLNNILSTACSRGYKDLALLTIKYGADSIDTGLWNACYLGHMDLALLMIEKGATAYHTAFCYACEAGHTNLILLMIDKGVTAWSRD